VCYLRLAGRDDGVRLQRRPLWTTAAPPSEDPARPRRERTPAPRGADPGLDPFHGSASVKPSPTPPETTPCCCRPTSPRTSPPCAPGSSSSTTARAVRRRQRRADPAASQRTLERAGLRIACTRTVWRLGEPTDCRWPEPTLRKPCRRGRTAERGVALWWTLTHPSMRCVEPV
jgi:hypothetical protein